MNPKCLFLLSAAVASLLSTIAPIRAQGTAFTYQGWLNQGGVSANGLYDVQASLFTNLSGGTAFAGPITEADVAVSNGLFVATLDFGNVFDGTTYWLELSVRTNGVGGFTVLTPRQQLTPTPYASFALTSSNLSGALSLAQLPAGVVTNNSTGVTLSGSFTGDASALTNLLGTPLGNYGMNNIQALWGRMNQQGRVRILSIGDSTGSDVEGGLTPYLEKAIGINGSGVTVQVPLAPYLNYTMGTPNLVSVLRPEGTVYSNWWGQHYGLSNSATLYVNRYRYRTVGTSWPMDTNVLSDTAFYAWVNRPNGGSLKLEISTNGLPFYTIATIDTSATSSPSLGQLYYSFPKTNVTWRMTGTGGGDGYAEVLMGGLFVTNGPGALMWNICSPGSDWSMFVAANTNVLIPYLTNIQPDLILIQSTQSPVSQYVIDLLSNCSPAQIVIMACPPSAANPDDSTYRLNYTNRMTVLYNAPTNRFNHIAFCDPWSSMTDTNANALYGFYLPGDPVHFTYAGELYMAHTFLQSSGLGDESLGVNISPAGRGSDVNLFNTEAGVPVGVNFWNADGRFGTFAVAAAGPGSTFFLGLTAVRDLIDYEGILAYDAWRQPAPVPSNGPFDVMTNFSLFWQSGSAMSLLVPGGPGELSLNGILNRTSDGASPEVCRITRNGQMFLGYYDWAWNKPDNGSGVLSVHNAIYVDQGGSGQVLITNGNVGISGQFNGSGAGLTNMNLALNTNNFSGVMVAGAACLTNMTGNITITGVSGADPTRLWSAYLLCVNNGASPWTVAFPASCTGQGQGMGPVYYVTNGTTAEFQLNGFGNLYTNVNWSPHW